MRMTDEALRRKIARIAADSVRVQVTAHARKRMRERHILLTQVLAVLRRGHIDEPASCNVHGHWQCTLMLRCAGDEVRIVAVVETNGAGEVVIVLTAMR